jgi:ATP dependent DNA ligase domain/DNA ligase OB-like domain
MIKQEKAVKKIAVTSGAALIAKAKSAPAKKDELYELYTMCEELNTTNSMNGKLEILKKYPQCKQLLTYTYDPFRQYYASHVSLQKHHNDLIEYSNLSFIEILDKLSNREVTGHKAIALVNGYVWTNLQYQELIYNIFKRNLKVRVDASLINRIWPGTVPTFEVALAYNYEHRKGKVDFTKQKWFASRKLDGCRCITVIKANGDVTFLSRSGKEFTTLDKVKEALQKSWGHGSKRLWPGTGGIVLDGEICIVDKNGNENFQDVIKLIKRKDFTIPNPKYKIFDMMPLEVFEGLQTSLVFSERIKLINLFVEKGFFDRVILDPVEQRPVTCEKDLTDFVAEGQAKGWEGLILRLDTEYEGGRSKDMLKVKQFKDAEYVVKGTTMGPIRIIENGKEVTKIMLSDVKIEHKGNVVSVGSGFSQKQRQEFYAHPEKIVGKTICVKYFEESKDQNGAYSLRFPVVKAIYEGKRDF